MGLAITLFTIWTVLVIGAGTFMNYLAGLTGMSMIISASSIIVLILEVIMILIGLMFLLLYKWSCRKGTQLECFLGRTKNATKRAYNSAKENTKDYVANKKADAKQWYDKQWFAIEDIAENIPDECKGNNETAK